MGRNALAPKRKNTKPVMFIKDPNDNDSVNTDSSRIANVVNDHFASIGLKLSNKLLTVQRNYFYFMNGSNSSDSSSAFNLVTPHAGAKPPPKSCIRGARCVMGKNQHGG